MRAQLKLAIQKIVEVLLQLNAKVTTNANLESVAKKTHAWIKAILCMSQAMVLTKEVAVASKNPCATLSLPEGVARQVSITIENTVFRDSHVTIEGSAATLQNIFFIDTELFLNNTNRLTDSSNIEFLTYSFTRDRGNTGLWCNGVFTIRHSIVLGRAEVRRDIFSECNYENSIVPATLTGSGNFL